MGEEKKASINLWDLFDQMKVELDKQTVECVSALGLIVGDKNGAGCTSKHLADGLKAYKKLITTATMMAKVRAQIESTAPTMPGVVTEGTIEPAREMGEEAAARANTPKPTLADKMFGWLKR